MSESDISSSERTEDTEPTLSEGFESGTYTEYFEEVPDNTDSPQVTNDNPYTGENRLEVTGETDAESQILLQTSDTYTGVNKISMAIQRLNRSVTPARNGWVIVFGDMKTDRILVVHSSDGDDSLSTFVFNGDEVEEHNEISPNALPDDTWTDISIEIRQNRIIVSIGEQLSIIETEIDFTEIEGRVVFGLENTGMGTYWKYAFDDVSLWTEDME